MEITAAACSGSDWNNLLFPQTLPNTWESESICGIFGWYICFSHLIFLCHRVLPVSVALQKVYTKCSSILQPQTLAHLGVIWPRERVVPLLITLTLAFTKTLGSIHPLPLPLLLSPEPSPCHYHLHHPCR